MNVSLFSILILAQANRTLNQKTTRLLEAKNELIK